MPNSAEIKNMIDALHAIPQAMQSLEREKAELERNGAAQERKIAFLIAEVDRSVHVRLEYTRESCGMKCVVV